MNIFEMSLAGGVLIAAIVLIRTLALYRLSKSLLLFLWLAAGARLLMPIGTQSILGVLDFLVSEAAGVKSAEAYEITISTVEITTDAMAAVYEPPAGSVFEPAVIWQIGALILFFIFCGIYYINYSMLGSALPITGNAAPSRWLAENQIRRPLRLLVSDRITTPLAVGVIRPKIIFPKTMDWEDGRLAEHVLSHELRHIRHFDMLWKTLLMAVLCLHWFNPLVWLMYVLANRDLELACDENVLKQSGESAKAEYALSLIKMAELKSEFIPVANGFSRNAIEERIMSVMKYKKSSGIAVALSLSLMLTTAVAVDTGVTFISANNSYNYSEGFVSITLSDGYDYAVKGGEMNPDGFEDISFSVIIPVNLDRK